MTPPITKALLQSIEKLLQEQGEKLDALLGLLLNGEVPFVEKKQGSEAKNVCHSCSLVFDDTTDVCSDCGATLVSIPILVTEFPVDDYAAVAPASSDPAPKQRRKPEPPLDGSDTWPEWFSLGHGMKGWKVELLVAEEWAYRNSFSEEYLLDKIYVVRGWWNADHEKKGRDPYRTFQRACRENWGAKAARAPASTPDQDQERHRAGYEKPRRMVGREDAPDKD